MPEIRLLPNAQQPAVGRGRGWKGRSLPREPSLTLRLLPTSPPSHAWALPLPTGFCKHRLWPRWPQWLGRQPDFWADLESGNSEHLGPETQPVPRPVPQGLWAVMPRQWREERKKAGIK